MNRNYYCKVNSQEEADELLEELKILGENIKNFSYISDWNYIIFTTEEYWALSCKNDYSEDFKNKQEVSANELVQYVKGELPKKEVEFEVGKWYKLIAYNKTWYIKFKGVIDEIVTSICHITDDKTFNGSTAKFGKVGTYEYTLLENLSEIQQYLPDGHPDKQPKTLTINDLVEGEIYYTEWEKGDNQHIFKYLGGVFDGCENYCIIHNSFTKSTRYFGGKNRTYERNLRLATPQERKWLIVCIKQDKFIEQSELDKYDDEGNLIQNFEFGKWYKNKSHLGEVLYFIKSDEEFYGFTNNNEWIYSKDIKLNLFLSTWTLATDQEVSDRLLEYAKSKYILGKGKTRGCTINDKYSNKYSLNSCAIEISTEENDRFGVRGGGACLYANGKWRAIVESPKEQVVDNEEFKVGDWVITKGYSPNYDGKGLKITKIKDNKYCYFEPCENTTHNFGIEHILRKVLPHEIPNSNHLDLENYASKIIRENIKLIFGDNLQNPLIPEECTKQLILSIDEDDLPMVKPKELKQVTNKLSID